MTAAPSRAELARKRPANAPARPSTRREDRVIEGTAWERVGLISGSGITVLIVLLLLAAGMAGLVLSLATPVPD